MLSIICVALFGGVILDKPDISAMTWFAGRWQCNTPYGQMEENWGFPEGKTILATSRIVNGDRTVHKEFLLIEQRGEVITYTVILPGIKQETFTLSKLTPNELVVESATNDYPSKITYRRDGSTMTARIEGTPKGKEFKFEEFPMVLKKSP